MSTRETSVSQSLELLEAAEDYVERADEILRVTLDPEEADELAIALRNRTLAVFADPQANFDHEPVPSHDH